MKVVYNTINLIWLRRMDYENNTWSFFEKT